MDFLQEFEAKTHAIKIKRLRDNFQDLNRVLTHEKTKMPLGAKLTQNDFKGNFLKWILSQNEMKTYSNYLKGLKQSFERLRDI